MDTKTIHDLAVAYAQAVLISSLHEDQTNFGTNQAINTYLKSYYFAKNHIPEEYENIDMASLE